MDDPVVPRVINALVPERAARRLTRRRFLEACATPAVLGIGLGACGPARPSAGEAEAEGEGALSVYTWAEYVDPANANMFGRSHGVTVRLDAYDSDEAMMAKLELAGRGAGYDLIAPSTRFLPQLVRLGLIRKLDRTLIPSFDNQDPAIVALKNQPGGDPGGEYTVVKDWGSTGFVYDRRMVHGDPTDWRDFMRTAASPGVSGLVSLLSSPSDVTGIVFWRDGIDWRTTDPAHLDHAERVLLDELAPHVKAFDGFPGVSLLAGEYALSQAWNGDARHAVIEDPDRYRWVLGAPAAELWIDAWAILTAAPNVAAAHAFIEFMLQPEVSAREVQFHGYNTGVTGVEAFLPADMPARHAVFFTAEEVARLVPGAVNEAQDRLVEIFNRLKVAAGRA